MSWPASCWLLRSIWCVIRRFVPEGDRQKALTEIMFIFSGGGCTSLVDVICDEWPESQPAYDQWYALRTSRYRGSAGQPTPPGSVDMGGQYDGKDRPDVDPYVQ